MDLDEGTLRLIAAGASVAANCLPCLEYNVNQALACGLAPEELEAAIKVGRMVRKGAASKMDELIANLTNAAPVSGPAAAADCCSS